MWCGVQWCKSCITIQTSNIKIKKCHYCIGWKVILCIWYMYSLSYHVDLTQLYYERIKAISWVGYMHPACVWIPRLWGTHCEGDDTYIRMVSGLGLESCALNSIGCCHVFRNCHMAAFYWVQCTGLAGPKLLPSERCIYEMHDIIIVDDVYMRCMRISHFICLLFSWLQSLLLLVLSYLWFVMVAAAGAMFASLSFS